MSSTATSVTTYLIPGIPQVLSANTAPLDASYS